MTRAERDTEHRERLLLAAAEVFAEGSATVARIIERAGVGRSTFYEFFDSPEHLFDYLEQRALRALADAIDLAVASARTPLEQVRAIVRGWLAALENRPSDARVVLSRRMVTEILSPGAKLLHERLERAVKAARLERIGGFNAADALSALSATAAVELLTRHHLQVARITDAQRVLSETIVKLLR